MDVSKLDLLVSHRIGTLAKIEKISNMNLSNLLTFFDVFVVRDFNISLLYVHKVCKDSNCEVILMNMVVKFRVYNQRRLWGMV